MPSRQFSFKVSVDMTRCYAEPIKLNMVRPLRSFCNSIINCSRTKQSFTRGLISGESVAEDMHACTRSVSSSPEHGHHRVAVVVEVLLYVHRNRRFIRDGSPGRPPRLSHSS